MGNGRELGFERSNLYKDLGGNNGTGYFDNRQQERIPE